MAAYGELLTARGFEGCAWRVSAGVGRGCGARVVVGGGCGGRWELLMTRMTRSCGGCVGCGGWSAGHVTRGRYGGGVAGGEPGETQMA